MPRGAAKSVIHSIALTVVAMAALGCSRRSDESEAVGTTEHAIAVPVEPKNPIKSGQPFIFTGLSALLPHLEGSAVLLDNRWVLVAAHELITVDNGVKRFAPRIDVVLP